MFYILCFFSLFFSIAAAEQPASLGKLLAKRYPTLQDDDQSLVLISLKDKGTKEQLRSIQAQSLVSERSLRRRMKVLSATRLIDERDYPLDQSYVASVAQHVITLRHQLKWFNAVSAIATKQQIETLRHLPFVKNIELIGRWKTAGNDERESPLKESSLPTQQGTATLDYGTSFTQLNQINVPALHNLGIYGQGITICVLDNGFRLLTHEAFASMNIIAQHDFVDHKTSVIPNNPNTGFGSHGVNTLSTIGGYKPGQLIGPAFKSNFILARTENDSSETPVEEDNWAKALEWADSIGVDVTSTSLGYLTYNAPYTSWTWIDMDGATTLITQAADHAAALGIVVVNSAGNDASRNDPNTLIAPADGFDVITVGAVNSSGVRSSFSSYGPTFDGRTKPDVMAMGSGVKVASSTVTTGYGSASGTSFSCPLTAGVAALLLCANPQLSPTDIADALRQTADNADAPDNFLGWGIVNALDAMNFNSILPLGKIRGEKFNDLNGNGILDGGEPGLAGITIRLSGTTTESTLTDLSGNYLFDSLAIGSYAITENVPVGWVKTLPANPYTVSLLHGTDTAGFNFGNYQLNAIHGMKFNDLNQNGTLDTLEPGLQGWRIRINGPMSATATTDTNGAFAFINLQVGTYTVSESSLVGWNQSLPPNNGVYTIVMYSGLDTMGLNFGNYYSPANNYYVYDGWNLLSLPNGVSDPRKSSVYPAASSHAFRYDGSYQSIDTLPNGVGYWLKFLSAQNIYIPGTTRTTDTVIVKQGWNMIGALSNPVWVPSIQQIPNGIVTSNYFFFNGSYQVADSLRPHTGYWVKVNANGKLVMNGAMSAEGGAESKELRAERGEQRVGSEERKEILLNRLNSLTFKDGAGHQQTLYFGKEQSGIQKEHYELPPVPPEGAFDVRFASQRMVQFIDAESANETSILVSTMSAPLTISWAIKETEKNYYLTVDGQKLSLNDIGTTHISHPTSHISLMMSPSSPLDVPATYSLGQNYPNPFNPTTQLQFAISKLQLVTLKVYDVLGREVATIVNEEMQPGTYTRTWDATNIPSGVYFYKLRAGNFSEMKKMLLMK